jgi:polyisoprenoid-binding protein YceI
MAALPWKSTYKTKDTTMTTLFWRDRKTGTVGAMLATGLVCMAAGGPPAAIEIQSGMVSFEAPTNMPGVEVKGKSNALTAHVGILRDGDNLSLLQIRAGVPVRSLATGMKVRDEHMRRYIFTAPDGSEPDLVFTSDPVNCTAAGVREFMCTLVGSLSIRGIARPFTMELHTREQGGSVPSYHATGDAVVKLSDYSIEPPSQFGVKPANEVRFHLDFNAKQAVNVSSNLGGAR